MTNEEKIKMFSMRLEGCTLQQIGDKYGITRERVRQVLDDSAGKRVKGQNWIYPNLRKYLNENKINACELAENCGVS